MSDMMQANDESYFGNGSANEFLDRAAHACETGDLVLGMYLYLAAYEKAAADPTIPDGAAVTGLQEAWHLACSLRERSMAEYVFEKLEPFLRPDEVAEYATELQELALDRLEEFGFSRAELEQMTDKIAGEFLGGQDVPVKFESIMLPGLPSQMFEYPDMSNLPDLPDIPDLPDSFEDLEDVESDESHADNISAAGKIDLTQLMPGLQEIPADFLQDLAEAQATDQVNEAASDAGSLSQAFEDALSQSIVPTPSEKPIVKHAKKRNVGSSDKKQAARAKEAPFNYSTLVGYDEAIALMRDFGIGLDQDDAFQNFVGMMNERHGLKHKPALDTILFRSAAVEDAVRFLEATIGELGLPTLRMSMEEGLQGMPLLCVTAQEKNRPRMNHAQNRFEGPGILIIDDLDMWTVPVQPEEMEGLGGFFAANISRGAREAINLIRSAVEDPRVYVFATASTAGEIDPFFYELLEPMTVVDISNPNEAERDAIWQQIMRDHPSMQGLDRKELTRLSSNLARFDIFFAAREAVEEAYKRGLIQRMFVPVSQQNIYDKLAACQPLGSEEYRSIEDEMLKDFRDDLDHLEDLLDGTAL